MVHLKPLILVAYCLATFVAGAQIIEHPNPWQFSLMVGGGVGRFEIKGIETEKYPTTEFKVGGVVHKPFTSKMGLRTGLNICIKAKRKSYLIDGKYYYGKGLWIPRLDETTSKKTHVAFELPVALYVKNGAGSELAGGFMGRAWQATDLSGDVLKSQQEYGLWGALTQNISKRIQIGAEVYWGLSRFPTGILIGGPKYTVKNNFLTGNVIYRL